MIRKFIKISIFSLVAFAFSAVGAQAAMSCHVSASCSGSEINILELSDTSNAHAGLPGSGYPYAVCCSGASGLSASCSGGEVVAKLSGSTNAHVRLNTESDYPGSNNSCMSVSSGTLTIENQDNDCSGFDTTVLSLAKVPTNSHVGEGSMYPHKICASYKAPTSGGGGWIPNFFGGGTNPNSNPTSPVVSTQPTTIVSIPVFSFNPPSNSTIASNDESSEPSTGAINDQATETVVEIVNQGEPDSNFQVAAAVRGKSGLGNLITSTPFKVISIIFILGLILVSRRMYSRAK